MTTLYLHKVFFFRVSKSGAFKIFNKFCKIIQNEKDLKIKSLRSDYGSEFQNEVSKKIMKNVIFHTIFQF